MVLAGVLVVLVDNSYGPGGPGVVLAGVLVVLVCNSYGPGGPWVVLAGLTSVRPTNFSGVIYMFPRDAPAGWAGRSGM